ncbi:MAG: ion transporter [Planctomycetota bacterium]
MSESESQPATLHADRSQRPETPGLRQTLYDVIFEAETPAGRWFDIWLLVAILISIVVVALETVEGLPAWTTSVLWSIEWGLTGLFTIEYILRIYCSRNSLRYVFAFWGLIDLLSIVPVYAGLFFGPARSFQIVRSIRLLRIFRVLKLWRLISEADALTGAIWRAREKIVVFLGGVLVAVTISGTLMYEIENSGPEPSKFFTNIPISMYWAIVTMTTVGYGDIVAQTIAGKFISSLLILLGYSLIIVPTGFVSAEGMKSTERDQPSGTDAGLQCPRCDLDNHRRQANYCDRCGERLTAAHDMLIQRRDTNTNQDDEHA